MSEITITDEVLQDLNIKDSDLVKVNYYRDLIEQGIQTLIGEPCSFDLLSKILLLMNFKPNFPDTNDWYRLLVDQEYGQIAQFEIIDTNNQAYTIISDGTEDGFSPIIKGIQPH